MSLASQVNALATRVAQEIKANKALIQANTDLLNNPPVRILGVQTPALTGTMTTVGTGPVFNSTAEIEILNVPIVAGRLATGDILDADFVCDGFNAHTAVVTVTYRAYIDTQMLFSNSVSMLAGQSNRFRMPGRLWMILMSPTVVRGGMFAFGSTTISQTANMAGLLAVANQGAGSLSDFVVPDLTLARNLRLTAQLNVLTTTTDVRPVAIVVKRTRPGVP